MTTEDQIGVVELQTKKRQKHQNSVSVLQKQERGRRVAILGTSRKSQLWYQTSRSQIYERKIFFFFEKRSFSLLCSVMAVLQKTNTVELKCLPPATGVPGVHANPGNVCCWESDFAIILLPLGAKTTLSLFPPSFSISPTILKVTHW